MSHDAQDPVFDDIAFDSICDVFVAAGATTAPAEMHGLLVGQLCAGVQFTPKSWLRKVAEFMDPVDEFELSRSQQAMLQQLHDSTLSQLTDTDMVFAPLLPDDDTDLLTRLESLAQWCDGFLAGFALVEEHRHAQFSEIVTDALKDIAAIAQVGMENVEEGALDDDAEDDYMQVMEHVRLLVMNVFYEQVLTQQGGDVQAAIDVPAATAAVAERSSTGDEMAISSPATLFGKRNLH